MTYIWPVLVSAWCCFALYQCGKQDPCTELRIREELPAGSRSQQEEGWFFHVKVKQHLTKDPVQFELYYTYHSFFYIYFYSVYMLTCCRKMYTNVIILDLSSAFLSNSQEWRGWHKWSWQWRNEEQVLSRLWDQIPRWICKVLLRVWGEEDVYRMSARGSWDAPVLQLQSRSLHQTDEGWRKKQTLSFLFLFLHLYIFINILPVEQWWVLTWAAKSKAVKNLR